MEQEFVNYTEALELKGLGFNSPCYGEYQPTKKGGILHTNTRVNESGEHYHYSKYILAPLFQQAFRFLREEFNIDHQIDRLQNDSCPSYIEYAFEGYVCTVRTKFTYNRISNEFHRTYEEAEQRCLVEMIKQAKGVRGAKAMKELIQS